MWKTSLFNVYFLTAPLPLRLVLQDSIVIQKRIAIRDKDDEAAKVDLRCDFK